MSMCGTRVKLLTYLAGALASGLLAAAETAFADEEDEVFKATAAITVKNAQGTSQKLTAFDISFVDPRLRVYILGDRTNNAVDVVNTHNNQFKFQVGQGKFKGATGNNDTSGPDGVLIVHNTDGPEVWAGDGDSTLKVFTLAAPPNDTLIATVFTGGTTRVDEMCLDPRDHLVLMANNAEDPPFVTFVSTHHPIVKGKQIKFDGANNTPIATNGIEQCQWSHRTGKFYIAVPEVNGNGHNLKAGGVSVLDPITQTVEKTFIIDRNKCGGPQGMAIGPDHQILLGCNAPSGNGKFSTVIIDERDGHVIATLDNESGADEVYFNPGNNHYFLARSAAKPPNQLLGIVDADPISEDPSITIGPVNNPPTSPHPNAHSVAADPVTNKTFLPIPGGLSTICSSVGGSDTLGCIAVFQSKDDDSCVAEGAPVTRVNDDGDPEFKRERCDDRDGDRGDDRGDD